METVRVVRGLVVWMVGVRMRMRMVWVWVWVHHWAHTPVHRRAMSRGCHSVMVNAKKTSFVVEIVEHVYGNKNE
jgi:hypothetical protein